MSHIVCMCVYVWMDGCMDVCSRSRAMYGWNGSKRMYVCVVEAGLCHTLCVCVCMDGWMYGCMYVYAYVYLYTHVNIA